MQKSSRNRKPPSNRRGRGEALTTKNAARIAPRPVREPTKRRPTLLASPVCTENLNTGVPVMKSGQDGARPDHTGSLKSGEKPARPCSGIDAF